MIAVFLRQPSPLWQWAGVLKSFLPADEMPILRPGNPGRYPLLRLLRRARGQSRSRGYNRTCGNHPGAFAEPHLAAILQYRR